MYCQHCNEYFSDTLRVCPNCGQPAEPEKPADKHPMNKTLIILVSVLAGAVIIASLIMLILFLSHNNHETSTASSTVKATDMTTAPTSPTANNIVPLTTVKPTQPPTKKPTAPPPTTKGFESYLVWLNAGVRVHGKPNASSGVTHIIETSTNYTIVEEATDSSGNLWGKLKSGIGWVNLSYPDVEETTVATQTPTAFESYLVWLNVGDNVYAQPDASSSVTYVIDTSTNYTIVDEAYDGSGTLWGKLKSGVGWVKLS